MTKYGRPVAVAPASERAIFGWSMSASAAVPASKRAITVACHPGLSTFSAILRRTGRWLFRHENDTEPALADLFQQFIGLLLSGSFANRGGNRGQFVERRLLQKTASSKIIADKLFHLLSTFRFGAHACSINLARSASDSISMAWANTVSGRPSYRSWLFPSQLLHTSMRSGAVACSRIFNKLQEQNYLSRNHSPLPQGGGDATSQG